MERVNDGCPEAGSPRDGGGVEGVVMDDVVPALANQGIDMSERALRHRRITIRGAAGAVQGGCEVAVVDPGVDDLHARYVRPGGGIDIHGMAAADETSRQIGQEGLGAAPLRLANGAHQRGHDRHPHAVITLNATSRGGLIPNRSNETRRWPRRRISAAASG